MHCGPTTRAETAQLHVAIVLAMAAACHVGCRSTIEVAGNANEALRSGPAEIASEPSNPTPEPAAPASVAGPDAAVGVSASAGSGADAASCIVEAEAAFCARLGANCGMLAGTDNCGVHRSVTSCGACDAPETCAGAGVLNVCGQGEAPSAEQTLVIVRHGESRSNACAAACGGARCCAAYACESGCSDCYCEAFVSDFTSEGWTQVQSVLPERLANLQMQWDKILVSPAWRTQTTVKAYLEQYDLVGQIVPELDECSVRTSCNRSSCSQPPWKAESYAIIEFEGAVQRLSPRPHVASWDPPLAQIPRPQYDHEAAHLEGENVIMDRAVEYIQGFFEAGEDTLLVITHHDIGGGLLRRLTGVSSEYSLDNAAAYTLLKRETADQDWRVDGINLE
jgi:broad specificity phosphatase PhoE